VARRISRGGALLESVAGALLRPWLRRSPMTAQQIMASRPERVLLVRAHDQIGDLICASPAFSAIRSLYPDSRITLVCMPRQEPVVRNHPHLDEVICFERRRFNASPRYALRFLRQIRGLKADGAFVVNSVSFSSSSALVAGLSGAGWIVGGDAGELGWNFPHWLYSLALPFEPDPQEPAIEHALRQLRRRGFELPSIAPVVGTTDADDRAAAAFLETVGEGPCIGIHPGAGKERNRWPAERFARVIQELEAGGQNVWLVQGPADAAAVAEVCGHLGGERPCLKNVDLCVVGAALRQSGAVLVNDTGVMHLAGAVGGRGVALFATTPASVWAPRGDDFTAIQSASGAMDGIGVAEVLAALSKQMGRERVTHPRP